MAPFPHPKGLNPMPNLDPDEQRALVKEAIQEWLDVQFATLGKWTLTGILAAAFGGLVYLALTGAGWHQGASK